MAARDEVVGRHGELSDTLKEKNLADINELHKDMATQLRCFRLFQTKGTRQNKASMCGHAT
jgi:hypothetical protein